ncbi:MAG: prepilin peptidase, partial [Planctomycetota bacterium]
MPTRRPPIPWSLLSVLAGGVGLAVAYVTGRAAWNADLDPFYEFGDLLTPYTIDVVVVTWLAWVGASIGSFLNVVAWRMPRGESVNGRSHCPRCLSKLLARDNFPVLGWLSLRGRCRTCRLPISARYPIVEASVGLTLVLTGVAELYRMNLPNDPGGHFHGPIRSPDANPITLAYLF